MGVCVPLNGMDRGLKNFWGILGNTIRSRGPQLQTTAINYNGVPVGIPLVVVNPHTNVTSPQYSELIPNTP